MLTFVLILGVTSLNAQSLGGTIGSSNSETKYSSELISYVERIGELDAKAGLRLFNDYSTTLDITLFSYYSDAYNKQRLKTNQAKGGALSYSHKKVLDDYEERWAEELRLWALIERLTGKN